MLWSIKRKDTRCKESLSNDEKSSLLDYFSRIDASKFSLAPNRRNPEVFFIADPAKASSGNVLYRRPDGFQIYSADPSYMPLAWDGMEESWSNSMKWFFQLPKDHKSL